MAPIDPVNSKWAREICEAFGLEHVISFDFHMAVNSAASIEVVCWASVYQC